MVIIIVAIMCGTKIAIEGVRAQVRISAHKENVERMKNGYPPLGAARGRDGAKEIAEIKRKMIAAELRDEDFTEYDDEDYDNKN
jgi:hypothetical protein